MADDKIVYFVDLGDDTSAWTPAKNTAKVFKTKEDAQKIIDKYKRGEVTAL